MKYDPVDLAWAAGFLDGEGNVVLRVGASYKAHIYGIRACNTVAAPIKALHKLFGGRLYSTPVRGNCSAKLEWCLMGRKSEAVLRTLLPYFKVKTDEVALVLAYLDCTRNSSMLERGTALKQASEALVKARKTKKIECGTSGNRPTALGRTKCL